MQHKSPESSNQLIELANAVREHCITAAQEGFQDASIQGLCTEGAMEAAISAMHRLDLNQVIAGYLEKCSGP